MYRMPCLAVAVVFAALALMPAAGVAGQTPDAVLRSDTALVPLRFVAEWLGAQVTFDKGLIKLARKGSQVELRLDSRDAKVGGRTVQLAQAPTLIGDATYVPLRFIAEGLGAKVDYDAKGAKVTISDGGRELKLGVTDGVDPVVLATRVFRDYSTEVALNREVYRGHRFVFFLPEDYPWLKAEMARKGRPVMDSGWPLKDARFIRLLESKGWRKGDAWFPYTVKREGENRVAVCFEEWNWWTTVFVQRTGTTWAAMRLEGDGEGNEGQPPLQWSVRTTESGFTFKKVR